MLYSISYRMDVKGKLDLNAKPTMTVTDNWLVSREVASIRAKLCLAEPTPIASRKSTPPGAVVCPVSRKTAKQAPVCHSATISFVERTPSASSRQLAPLERRPLALVWTVTTEILSRVVLALRTFVQPLYLVRSLKSASLGVVRNAVKASLAVLELVVTKPPTSASVCLTSSAKRISSAFLPLFRPSVSHPAVATLTANTANLIAAFAMPVHRAILTNRAVPRRRRATPPNAVSTPNAVKESTVLIASAQLVIRAIHTSPVKV